MTKFSIFNRIATAAVGALVISTAFVAAAVGPATAAGRAAYAASQPTVQAAHA